MPIGKLVFAQLMDFLPLHTFRRCVARYPSNYPTKTFSHLDQYLSMAFAQLTFRESLRDIEVCLRAHEAKLYHLGIRGHVARSNLGVDGCQNPRKDGAAKKVGMALAFISAAPCSRTLGGKRWLGGKPCQGRQPPQAGAAGPPVCRTCPTAWG